MPHYNPNNVINTGAKYDPNAANSGMGAASSGGSSPSFTNGMGMKAQQQLSSSAANWTGSASGSGAGSSCSAGSGTGSGTGTGSQGSGSSGILKPKGVVSYFIVCAMYSNYIENPRSFIFYSSRSLIANTCE